jgi:hypothetical protein
VLGCLRREVVFLTMYKRQSHRGTGRGFHRQACEPGVSPRQLDDAVVRVREANPQWSRTRIRQRAMVEAIKVGCYLPGELIDTKSI